MLNYNVGILGHVDSGKTSLAKQLSTISSTACFDKNPQSKERGITLDLGFSSFKSKLRPNVQYTLVDCPGHASLIRTIIGGAQIIDLMILVVDMTKGIQTQTAECLILGEILCPKLLVCFNKIDLVKDEKQLSKTKKSIKAKLASMNFKKLAFCQISALTGAGVEESFLPTLDDMTAIPLHGAGVERTAVDRKGNFVMAVDHCFQIKGKGSVLTGTVLSGSVNVDDEIELPEIGVVKKKVKSIQVFKKAVQSAKTGDRCGICIGQFDSEKFERGICCKSNTAKWAHSIILPLHAIPHYKRTISSKEIFHVTVGHSTRTAKISLFTIDPSSLDSTNGDSGAYAREYNYLHLDTNNISMGHGDVESGASIGATMFVRLDFGEKPILFFNESLFIASKLDLDTNDSTTNCRLAFHGKALDHDFAPSVFKTKVKLGVVDRLHDADTVIVKNMFKKETNLELFKGMQVQLSTGEKGTILGPFGKSGKIKVELIDEIEVDTLLQLDVTTTLEKPDPVKVELKFMKKAFDKHAKLVQL